MDFAQFLVVEYGADVMAQDNDGSTALHQASSNGHVDLAQFLVEHGVDAMAQDKEGATPLHRASQYGHVDLTRFLIEHGADVTAQDKDGSTPLDMASFNGHVDLVRFLIDIKHGADGKAQTTPQIQPTKTSKKRETKLKQIL